MTERSHRKRDKLPFRTLFKGSKTESRIAARQEGESSSAIPGQSVAALGESDTVDSSLHSMFSHVKKVLTVVAYKIEMAGLRERRTSLKATQQSNPPIRQLRKPHPQTKQALPMQITSYLIMTLRQEVWETKSALKTVTRRLQKSLRKPFDDVKETGNPSTFLQSITFPTVTRFLGYGLPSRTCWKPETRQCKMQVIGQRKE
jgi:hypothetical protein